VYRRQAAAAINTHLSVPRGPGHRCGHPLGSRTPYPTTLLPLPLPSPPPPLPLLLLPLSFLSLGVPPLPRQPGALPSSCPVLPRRALAVLRRTQRDLPLTLLLTHPGPTELLHTVLLRTVLLRTLMPRARQQGQRGGGRHREALPVPFPPPCAHLYSPSWRKPRLAKCTPDAAEHPLQAPGTPHTLVYRSVRPSPAWPLPLPLGLRAEA